MEVLMSQQSSSQPAFRNKSGLLEPTRLTFDSQPCMVTPEAPRAQGKRSFNPFEWDDAQDAALLADKGTLAGVVAYDEALLAQYAPQIQPSAGNAMLQDVCAYLSIRINTEAGIPVAASQPLTALYNAPLDAELWPETPYRHCISSPGLDWATPALVRDTAAACAATPPRPEPKADNTALFDHLCTCPAPGPVTPPERTPLVRALSSPMTNVWEPFLDGMCVKAPRQAVRAPAQSMPLTVE